MTATAPTPVARWQQPMPQVLRPQEPRSRFGTVDRATRRFLAGATVTLFTLMLASVFLLPLAYGVSTSLKSQQQLADPNQPILPRSAATAVVDGEEVPLLDVPLDGGTRTLALVERGRQQSTFVDPDEPDVPIVWEGNWRTLEPRYELDVHLSNYDRVLDTLDFTRLLRNTALIAGIGMAGTVIASTLVAYGLSRFALPGKSLILISLVATIILPRFVTLVPQYAVYQQLGWIGTWLPLIVPHFFANAYNVFLLRQFFLTIPRDLDEAAAIDGAGPLRTLMTIVVPQARAAIVVVALFHFFFAWNDFFEPLIYLSGERDLQPISVGLYSFVGLFRAQPNLVQAGALLAMIVPVLVFVFSQRFFLKGIDISGSLK